MPERRYAPRRVKNALDRMNGQIAEIPVDLVDRGDEFVVEADLPGYTTQAIDVTVRPKMLRITATPEEPAEDEPRRRERARRVRQRLIGFPHPVREKTASASYHNGVLRVTVEKRAKGGTRTVPIE